MPGKYLESYLGIQNDSLHILSKEALKNVLYHELNSIINKI